MSQPNQEVYDTPPVLVHQENVPPNHQEILLSGEEARKVAELNVVVLQFVVTLNGLPAKVRAIRSTGPQLDEKAVATVRGDRFKPALKDGKPVLATIYLKFSFEPAQK
jgi:TonB family protein